MANITKHKFVSIKTQSPDVTLVSKNEWNDEHVFNGGVNGQALIYDNTATDHVKWTTQPKVVDISVVDYATGGNGTKADPWTGWEVAFSAVSSGRYTATEFRNYLFASGWFTTSNMLDMKRYVSVSGKGEGTVIKYTGSTIAIRFLGIGTPASLFDITKCSLNSFVLICTAATVGISITNVYDINLHQVDVYGSIPSDTPGSDGSITGCSVAGVFIGASTPSACFLIRFNQCRIQLCLGEGVLIGNNTNFTSSLITTVSFVGCRIQGNQRYGVYTEKYMVCLTFESSDIEGNTLGDVWADIVNGISFVNCYFENGASVNYPNIAIGSGAGGNGGGVVITGCYFNHHLTSPAISIGASLNEQRGVTITGNYFTLNTTATAIKLGRITMGTFCNNYVASVAGNVMFDLSTAILLGCQLQNITVADPFVHTFMSTGSPEILAVKNYSNAMGTRAEIHFKDQNRTRAIIASNLTNVANNEGSLAINTGIGGDLFRMAAAWDYNVTAEETPMYIWDITAGAIRRVSRGVADSGGVGYRVLRIPN